ncbi:MAG TPA: PKD domain-containing protein [Candidatus Binataceae bacterium]|nr:PKD domain-containing protein [Candidatus Binataceae bacterium]
MECSYLPLKRWARLIVAISLIALIGLVIPAGGRAVAQDMNMDSSDSGSMMLPPPGAGSAPNPTQPPPMQPMRIMQPITGSMAVAPPYGVAPLKVGFFVLANDPEGIGFLTYSWNFGDGTVSSLPPELYIFHTYNSAGTYVCTLTIKTVDGRSKTFVQGVDVQAPA